MSTSAPVQELQAIKQAVRLNPDSIKTHASRIAQLSSQIRSDVDVVDAPRMVAADKCKKHA